ncbi:hypothetical protein KDL29_05755 [bacterium]|nr:hypothetical protein [bacterium]
MFYEVSALLIEAKAIEFRRILKDGTIRQENPDGREICESMMRARFQDSGRVHWTQASFSSEPLKYEIDSVYRHYFEDIQVNEVEGHISFHGPMFMDHLLVLELQALGHLPRQGEDR